MDQCMKAEPASPDQRVPSQSNTAMCGVEGVDAGVEFGGGEAAGGEAVGHVGAPSGGLQVSFYVR